MPGRPCPPRGAFLQDVTMSLSYGVVRLWEIPYADLLVDAPAR